MVRLIGRSTKLEKMLGDPGRKNRQGLQMAFKEETCCVNKIWEPIIMKDVEQVGEPMRGPESSRALSGFTALFLEGLGFKLVLHLDNHASLALELGLPTLA